MKRNCLPLSIVFFCLVSMGMASGQDFEWSAVSGGSWLTHANWLGGTLPSGVVGNVVIRPDFGGDINGPPADITVENLTIGADQGRGGLATRGGTSLFIVNSQVTVEASGLLYNISGSTMAIAGDAVNSGEVNLGPNSRLLVGGTFINSGILAGNGQISGPVSNSGRIEQVTSPTASSVGQGIEFLDAVTNLAGGLIAYRNQNSFFQGGLINQGVLSFDQRFDLGADLFGDIENTGTIGLSSETEISIIGDLIQNGSLNLIGNSQLIVFGDFSGAGGTVGPGTLEVLGTLNLGNSPAAVSFGGDLAIGQGTLIEIGGLNSGEFDSLDAVGDVSIAGKLEVAFIDGFTASAGDVFEIITGASVLGSFDTINLPPLPGDLQWSVNQSATSVELIAAASGIPGDFDLDADVDGSDFLAWQRGESPSPLSANDLADWQANFGAEAGSFASSQTVPEPTSLALLAISLMLGQTVVRHSRHNDCV